MTDQRSQPGYRGALPPAEDRLAGPWVIVVVVLFVLMFALSFLGFPESLFPDPTPQPVPTVSPGATSPIGSGVPSASPSP